MSTNSAKASSKKKSQKSAKSEVEDALAELVDILPPLIVVWVT